MTIKSTMVSEAAGVLASVPRRCVVWGRTDGTYLGAAATRAMRTFETRCLLDRYHDGPCSFSILGVGREGVR